MSEEIKHIMLIDDRADEDRRDNYVAAAYKTQFPEVRFTIFSDAYKAIDFLKENDVADHPNVLVLDCCETSFMLDSSFGYTNANTIINWHLEYAPDLPRYVLFQSSDEEYAVNSAEILEDETGIKCFAVNRGEYLLAKRYFSKNNDIRDEYVSTSGFREFLNLTLDLDIPTTQEDLIKWQISNRVWETKDIIDFAEDGFIQKNQALVEVYNESMQLVNKNLGSEVEIEIDDEDGTLSRSEIYERQWDAKQLRFEFQRAVGESVHGYLAFSIDDVKKLARSDKKAVLVLSKYDGSFVQHLGDLSAIVLMANNATGHMSMLLESHGVTGVLGSKSLDDSFIADTAGNSIKSLQRIEGEDKKLFLASYEDSVFKLGRKHSKPYYMNHEDDETEPEIPVLEIDLDTLDVDHIISNGDAVTVQVQYGQGSLYAGHHKIAAGEVERYNRWIYDVSKFLDEWNQDRDIKKLRFKSNIDNPNQSRDVYGSGVGLLRTEHFILSNDKQLQALKKLCLYDHKKSLKHISKGLEKDLDNFLSMGDSSLRVRLLDAPLSEFYAPSEQQRIKDRFGEGNSRGVQLATQMPEIYEAQLNGIFSGLKKKRDDEIEMWGDHHVEVDFPRGLEILIPTVETAEELCFAKDLVEKAADKYEVPHDKYAFGSMLETLEACENIKDIAPHCDFISIGTNDLTSEVLRCERDDWEKRNQYLRQDGFDPFVTLHPLVFEKLTVAIEKARKANPNIQVDLCGAHGTSLESLEMLRPLELDGVSVPNSEKNIIGLDIQYKYAPFVHENSAYVPKPKNMKQVIS